MALAVTTFEDVDLSDALVIVAFPTTGGAAPIAAHYLVRHLPLPLVGHIRVPELGQIMAVHKGRATGVVRIHGGEVACELEHGCPRVYIVITELTLPPPVLAELAAAILAWAKDGGAHLVLALEGVVRDKDDEEPDVYLASGQADVMEELSKAGAEPAGQAMVAGIAAHLLLDAPDKGVRAGAILVEASSRHPDGRAAAALIQALDKLLPEIKVDPKPLLDEALALEEEIQKATRPAADLGQPARIPHTFI